MRKRIPFQQFDLPGFTDAFAVETTPAPAFTPEPERPQETPAPSPASPPAAPERPARVKTTPKRAKSAVAMKTGPGTWPPNPLN